MKNVNNKELCGKYAVTTAERQQLWDCSLYKPFNGPLVLPMSIRIHRRKKQILNPNSPVLADLPKEPSSAEMKADEDTEKPSTLQKQASLLPLSGSKEKVFNQNIWGQTKTPWTRKQSRPSSALPLKQSARMIRPLTRWPTLKNKLGLEDTMATRSSSLTKSKLSEHPTRDVPEGYNISKSSIRESETPM